MSFVNTRTALGEQAAFDALIAHTLTELNEDGIKILPQYCVGYQDNLISVNFPNVINIESSAFYYNALLETIDIGKQCSITNSAIGNCPKLKSLILRGTTGISTISNPNTFSGTPIRVYKAGIFVPRSLINDYLSNSYWSKYSKVIRAIEDMPITDLSTITNTWTQIKNMIDDESFFSSSYTIGDFKQIVYGEHTVFADIAKIDSTNKYVDFVLNNFDEIVQRNYTSAMASYADSAIKNRLDAIYTNELPLDLKAVISPVSKKYYKYDGEIETVTAPLWLLNTKDINLTGSYLKETEGEEYVIFNTADKRIKSHITNMTTQSWWIGSAYDSSHYMTISYNGNPSSNTSLGACGLLFGFRIQKTV